MNNLDYPRMAQILRHRLRNISSGIRGALGLIQEEGGDVLPPDLMQYFPLMLRECDALQEVAQRVSLFFDAPTPAMPMTAEVLTFKVVNEISSRFSGQDIRVRGSSQEQVNGWMEQALTEVIVNACEAAPNGTVDVRYRADKQNVIWTVADSGPGLSEEEDIDPFSPFFTTRPRQLGLGLAIARRYSECAGGYCRPTARNESDAAWAIDLACPLA